MLGTKTCGVTMVSSCSERTPHSSSLSGDKSLTAVATPKLVRSPVSDIDGDDIGYAALCVSSTQRIGAISI